MPVNRNLLLIVLGALLLRVILAQFVVHPGIGDPNHYYNLGQRLLDGHGFTIDYVWQFNDPPDSIEHPTDYWLPMTGMFAAGGMAAFGRSVDGAIVPFILTGTLLVLVTYAAAKQFGLGEIASLFVAAAAGVLPEFVLNSVRTDTTIINAVLVCGSILLLTRGLRHSDVRAYIGSGLLAGLAYLTRNDALLLLPMLAVVVVVHALWGNLRRWYLVLIVPALMLLVAAPWLIRNQQTLGYVGNRESEIMFFFTQQQDHFAYQGDFSLQSMLEKQAIPELIGKRLFEMAAGVKLMYTLLDVFLPVAVAGGLLLVIAARDRQRLLAIAPAVILLGGAYVLYTILVPFKGQSGSLKKVILTVIPLLLPLAGLALERAVRDQRILIGTAVLAIGFTGANAVELVRADVAATVRYLGYMQRVVDVALALPDTNGDDKIILMAQDPFMLRYYGVQSVMMPMATREGVLEVAERYGVDYIMFPPARPPLDPLHTGEDSDPRFFEVADVPGSNVRLFGHDASAE